MNMNTENESEKLYALAKIIRWRAFFTTEEIRQQEIFRAAEMESEALALKRENLN